MSDGPSNPNGKPDSFEATDSVRPDPVDRADFDEPVPATAVPDQRGRSRRDRSWPPPPEPLPVPVIDNHTHFDLTIDDDPRTIAEQALAAQAVGVEAFIQVGCELASAELTVALVEERTDILGAVALHPNEAAELAAQGQLADSVARIGELARHPRIRVIGETGLDFFRTGPEGIPAQRESFRAHIALAKELDRVLQIHDRDAHAQILEILAADGAPERTVFHCFSGDAELARRCVANGWYLSFAGTVTFKNAANLREALLETPLERILVETDAPFLAPHPHRGRPNAPYLLPWTLRTIADVKQVPLAEVCERVRATTLELYGSWT